MCPTISCLIWLDANVNDTDSRDTEAQLSSIINNFKKFAEVAKCQKFIEERSQTDQLAIVVSGQFGQRITTSIHELQNVISIYVYCMNKQKNEQWARNFAKVILYHRNLIRIYDFYVERLKVLLLILVNLFLELKRIIRFKQLLKKHYQ